MDDVLNPHLPPRALAGSSRSALLVILLVKVYQIKLQMKRRTKKMLLSGIFYVPANIPGNPLQ